jgi:lysophospholipase L1-like esterase
MNEKKTKTYELKKNENRKELESLQLNIKADKTKVVIDYSTFYKKASLLSSPFQKLLRIHQNPIQVPALYNDPLTLSFSPSLQDQEYLSKIINLKLTWTGNYIPVWIQKLKNIHSLTIPNISTLDGQIIPTCEYINGKKREQILFDEFESKWLNKRDIIFAGDSNMVGITRSKTESRQNIQAKGGRTTAEILNHLKISPDTKAVVIIGGGNDLRTNVPVEITKHNIDKIIQKIHTHNPQIKIILGTITPRAQKSKIHAQKAQEINKFIRKIAEQSTHITLIDWHQELSSNTNPEAYNPAFVEKDLIHPSVEGYKKIRAIIDRTLNQIYTKN